ncbi:MAG: hypothetical protein ACLQM6_07370 [Acidobacteriaceae bacterium]
METLFVLLYWPVVGVLSLFASRALLRKGVGPWRAQLIYVPLWVLALALFFYVIHLLHLHGRLLQIVGFVASQHIDGFYQFLYQFWIANCFYWSTPIFPNLREDWHRLKDWHRKKAAKAALAAGE